MQGMMRQARPRAACLSEHPASSSPLRFLTTTHPFAGYAYLSLLFLVLEIKALSATQRLSAPHLILVPDHADSRGGTIFEAGSCIFDRTHVHPAVQ